MVRICVYGSASARTPKQYLDVSTKLGELIAQSGHVCVNGGGKFGCMGAMNVGVRQAGGFNIGVIHEKFVVDGAEDLSMNKMIVAKGDNLGDRKKLLLDNADAVIVLPGGVGTYDEVFDAVCQKSLNMGGLKNKPICLLNYQGFYDGVIIQMNRAYDDGLLFGPVEAYFHIESDPAAAVAWCLKMTKAHESDNQFRERTVDRSESFSPLVKKSEHHFWSGMMVGVVAAVAIAQLSIQRS